MDRQPVRVTTYAWGKRYVDQLLNYTLASLLAPGNLPALAKFFDCTLAIVTEERFFDYVNADPLVQRAKSLCTVRLISLDDLIGEPWQYGISLAYALFRGFSDLGPAMTGTYLLFLNADFVLADGCYERLIPHMRRGEPILLSPSYCTVQEEVVPLLEAIREEQEGILAIPPRQLARLIIDHRHNTVRAKTISQSLVHFEYMDQAYWQLDKDTLLGHQMPISMVGMRPEKALTDINTFWDWGITYEFCPSRELTVLGDSDEFLMLELRSETAHLDLVRPGPTSPLAAASRMRGYVTQYQVDNARFPLTLHAEALPHGVEEARERLSAFFDSMLGHLSHRLLDHRNHAQWIYHRSHLWRNIEIKQLRAQLARLDRDYENERARVLKIQEWAPLVAAASRGLRVSAFAQGGGIARLANRRVPGEESVAELIAELKQGSPFVDAYCRDLLDQMATTHQQSTEELRVRLKCIEERKPLSWDDLGHSGSLGEGRPAQAGGGFIERMRNHISGVGQRMRRAAFGSVPHTQPRHPLHLMFKDIAAALHVADRTGGNILFVGEKDGLAARWIGAKPGQHLRISSAALLRDELNFAPETRWFKLCVVELCRADLVRIRKIGQAIAGHMQSDGRVLMYWINHRCEPAASLQGALAHCALMPSDGARLRLVCSAPGWGGFDMLQAALNGSALGIARHSALLVAGLLRLSMHKFYERELASCEFPPSHCLGLLVDINRSVEARQLTEVVRTDPVLEPVRLADTAAA